jgi:hypothetical protein
MNAQLINNAADMSTALVAPQPERAAGPLALLQSGVDLDKVERLWAMQVQWEANEAKKAYNEAFAAFKAEAVRIVKNRKVTAGPLDGKRYAELFAVVNAVTPALSAHGLSASWKLTRDDKDWIEVTCTLKHALGHCESVSMGGPPDVGGAKNAIQARASTVTYLERYTLKAITGLSEQEDDNDGAGARTRATEAAPEDDPMVQTGRDKSMDGTKALTVWWASLNEGDRKRLQPHFGSMKTAARKADEDSV